MPPYRRPIFVLIAINIAVFLMWNFGHTDTTFMEDNFLVSWTALMEGRYWVLLTSVFSHNAFWHIFMNMFVLNSFGSLLEQVLGKKSFLIFYVLAGVFSSFCHAAVSAFLMGAPDLPALGASGAISGLILIFSLVFPKQTILIMGIIPVPAIFGAFALIGIDLWGLVAQTRGGGLPIGHGAHLGGAFFGIFYYLFVIRPKVIRRSY